MKLLCSFLLPAVASSQLLGFGSSCPVIDLEITNVGYDVLTNLVAVAHSPTIELLNSDMPLTEEQSAIIYSSCLLRDEDESYNDLLAPLTLGIDGNEDVCGYANVDLVQFDCDARFNDCDGYSYINDVVFPGDSYDVLTLEPENTDGCSCSDMRISVLALHSADIKHRVPTGVTVSNDCFFEDVWTKSVAYLNSHELQSTTATTHTHAGFYGVGMGVSDASGDSYLKKVTTQSDLSYSGSDVSTNLSGASDNPVGSHDSMLVVFRPESSSSTNILALWALLMHNWW